MYRKIEVMFHVQTFLVYLFRYEVFTSVKIYIVVFWVMTLCTAADKIVCLNKIQTKIIFIIKQKNQHLFRREKLLTLKIRLSLLLLSFACFYLLQCLSFPATCKVYCKISEYTNNKKHTLCSIQDKKCILIGHKFLAKKPSTTTTTTTTTTKFTAIV